MTSGSRGPYYHGGPADLAPGDWLQPAGARRRGGANALWGEADGPLAAPVSDPEYVWFTLFPRHALGYAAGWAKRHRSAGHGSVYQVEPSGPVTEGHVPGGWELRAASARVVKVCRARVRPGDELRGRREPPPGPEPPLTPDLPDAELRRRLAERVQQRFDVPAEVADQYARGAVRWLRLHAALPVAGLRPFAANIMTTTGRPL